MALFPSFAGLSGSNSSAEDRAPADLEWLSNQSFTEDALKTQRRATERVQAEEPAGTSGQKRKEREDSHGRSKKSKKKKKKKHKKRSRENSESSGSESDTIYPSDLLKKDNADREEAQVRVSETFMWLDDLQTPTDSPFCIDRRADRANWEYKSLYRGDIASSSRCQTLHNPGEHCDCAYERAAVCIVSLTIAFITKLLFAKTLCNPHEIVCNSNSNSKSTLWPPMSWTWCW